MNWWYAMQLVNPAGRRYRPAPAPDSPLVREARELARRGQDLSLEERRERFDGLAPYMRLMQEYELARNPKPVEAPASWPSTIVELSLAALLASLVVRVAGPSAIAVAASVTAARSGVRRDARRRAARRYGTKLDDAPRLAYAPMWTTLVPLALRLGLDLRHRRIDPVPRWPFWLAVSIVREREERRSWRAALQASRTSTGRPLSSD